MIFSNAGSQYTFVRFFNSARRNYWIKVRRAGSGRRLTAINSNSGYPGIPAGRTSDKKRSVRTGVVDDADKSGVPRP